MNTLVKVGIGVGALVVVSRMLQLNKLVANVSVTLSKVRVHKVNLSGIEIAATAKINNPTGVTVRKSFPIAANRQSEVGELMMPLGWTTVLPLIGIKDITSIITLFSKNGTKGFLKSFSSPISMSIIMQVSGMTIETPKTVINK